MTFHTSCDGSERCECVAALSAGRKRRARDGSEQCECVAALSAGRKRRARIS